MVKKKRKLIYTDAMCVWLMDAVMPKSRDTKGKASLARKFNLVFSTSVTSGGLYSKAMRLRGIWKTSTSSSLSTGQFSVHLGEKNVWTGDKKPDIRVFRDVTETLKPSESSCFELRINGEVVSTTDHYPVCSVWTKNPE
jgi:hypothetical protein